MAYPTYTKQDLADFSGRSVATYPDYATTSALPQATLLFKIGTCLADWPEDVIDADLARMAILSMADAIVLSQPHQKVLSNPFNSETIGSYSYSKVSGAVATGLPTGIMWFDMALSRLGVCDLAAGLSAGGAIEVFEHDAAFTGGNHAGNVRMLSPQDLDLHKQFGRDPAPVQLSGNFIPGEGDLDLGDFNQDGGLLEG